jgi:hypothetical protein
VTLENVSAGAAIQITARSERHEHHYGQPLARWRYRSEIDGLVRRLVTGFVGREEEIQALIAFVADPRAGYLLLEAAGGMGKSSLLAQLLLRQESGNWNGPSPTLLSYFIRDPGWRRPEEYLASVNAQLLDVLGRRGGTPGDLLSLRAQFSELWADALAAASAERPLLLIVDALDEMAAGETTIADLMPTTLSAYAHVIVSSRRRPSARDAVPQGHPLREARALTLTSLDPRGVTALLSLMAVPPQLAQRLALRIHTLTRGEPLFAHAVAEDVAARGEAALAALEREPPAEAREYFRRQLGAIDKAAESDSTWRICEVLAAAKGAMSADELAGVLELSHRAVARALKPIERFIVGEERLQLFHRLLYELLQEEVGKTELARISGRIAAWCAAAQDAGWKGGAPRYALAHYAEHLYEAADHERLQALIDGLWLREHRRVFGAPRAFVRDAELAIASATAQEPPDVFHELRGALAVAAARSVALSVPPAAIAFLAATQRFEEAEGYAALADPDDARARAFAALAAGLARAGRTEPARAAFDLAIDALAGEWVSLAEEQLVRDVGDAAELVQGIEGLARVARALQRSASDGLAHSLRLARRAHLLGDQRWPCEIAAQILCKADAAIDEYRRVTPVRDRDPGTAEPGKAEDEADDDAGEDGPERQAWNRLVETRDALIEAVALAVAQRDPQQLRSIEGVLLRLPGPADSAVPAAALANGFATLGDARSAEAWAQRCLGSFPRLAALANDAAVRVIEFLDKPATASFQAQALDALVAKAREEEGYWHGDAMGHAIEAAALAGRWDIVGDLEKEIEAQRARGDSDLDAAFESLAVVAAGRGDLTRARASIEQMELGDGSMRDAARRRAVEALLRSASLPDARALAQEVTELDVRLDALGLVVRGALVADDQAFAAETVEAAIAASGNLDQPATAAYLLASIALALGRIGRRDDARRLALEAKASMDRTLPDARTGRDTEPLARALVQVGALDAVEPFIETMMESFRTRARRELVLALRADGQMARAEAIVQRMRDEDSDDYLDSPGYRLATIAELGRTAGDMVQARADLEEAERIYFTDHSSESLHQATALLEIVEEYAALGDREGAARISAQVTAAHMPGAQDIELSLVAAAGLHAQGDEAGAKSLASGALERFEPGDRSSPYSAPRNLPDLARLAGPAALPLLDRLHRLFQAMADPHDRTDHLRCLALSFRAAGDGSRALQSLREAMQAARSTSLFATLENIAESADILAELDDGDTLLRLALAYDDVVGWWSAGEAKTAPSRKRP